MGDILKKITQLLSEGSNIETSRSTGIILNSNYFDAVEDDGHGTTAGDRELTNASEPIQERKFKEKSDLT